ncbi:Mu transposase C-terminal domain-containing protein [Cupriavidus sp. CP313]
MKLSDAAPGHFAARHPLDIVQIDHTLADIILVDEAYRHTIGRPWLTLAIDVATRSVVALYVGFDRPNAATVALLLTRMVLSKAPWLASREVAVDWPMHGVPKVLHLDNAAEFKSKALRAGCNQYGIELMYRTPGRPYFGGHIERLNRTMMEKVHSLPGSTGSSTKGRKARKPEAEAALTLREFEQWLMYEIGQTYHHSAHRGLSGATPYSAWSTLSEASKPRLLPDSAAEELRFLIQFLPMARRTIQADGLMLFYLHYWHPIFAAWRAANRRVVVRYHPEDLSKV